MWLPSINRNWKVEYIVSYCKLSVESSSYYIFFLQILIRLISKSSQAWEVIDWNVLQPRSLSKGGGLLPWKCEATQHPLWGHFPKDN